ncbi:MAG: RNA-directed DNA polymerase [Ruminococcaceae bacterium]|nr:RNA-directed DNA polymerase [Oscillospiraceae bacterium]
MDSFKILNKETWLQTLNISEEELMKVAELKSLFYKKYRKEKPSGYRTIYIINKDSVLYSLQSKIQKKIFRNIFLPECVYGFRENCSYIDFLTPHISSKNKFYLRLDIKDFFESISVEYIKDFFQYYIDDKISNEEKTFIVNSIIDVTTLNGKFIQGAVTSPSISNFAFREIDIRILSYCRKLNVRYTRYADDMLFSSENNYLNSKHFIIAIQAIINDLGYTLNHAKTLKYKNEISLNGYVIGADIRLSRRKLHKINELIFQLSKSDFYGFENNIEKYHIKNQLAGYRSFLIQVNRHVVDLPYRRHLEERILTIEKLIIKHFT